VPPRGSTSRNPLSFDLIEHEDLRRRPFLDRKVALAQLLNDLKAVLLNEHIAKDGLTAFAYACQLGAEGIISKRWTGTYRSGPYRVRIKVRNPAGIAAQWEPSEV
jgi:bifunctional non-homologous end joining protein LigD